MIPVAYTRFTFTRDQYDRLEALLSEWKDVDIDDILVLIRIIRSGKKWGESSDRIEITPIE